MSLMQSQNLQALIRESKPLIMGILNVTPDSFSDGGQFNRVEAAHVHALQMIKDGAKIIDIGGESTRPGSKPVNIEEELTRVLPVMQSIRRVDKKIILSIDSSKPEVMRQAVSAGANMINDVNALTADGALETVAQLAVPICLMHKQGNSANMQSNPVYTNVVKDVKSFLEQRMQACVQAGIDKELLVIDPGFGFGKTLAHNMKLLGQLEEFTDLNVPVLVGLSRKSLFEDLLGLNITERLSASVSAAVISAMKGAAIIRVHDVKETVEAMTVFQHLN